MVKYCVGEYATQQKRSKSEDSKPIKKRICAVCASRNVDVESDTEPTSKKRRLREGDFKHEDEPSSSFMSDDDFETDDLDGELTMEM